MTTTVITLREYADLLDELAEDWDGDEPAVLIGDATGNLNVTEKDGYTQHGSVGYATEIFKGNGVFELGQEADLRFYGTMLIEAEKLGPEAQEHLNDQADGGDA